jgi:hypothetical protein
MTVQPPPSDVVASAAKVQSWLDQQAQAVAAAAPARVSDAEFAKMSAKQRLDHCRQFEQFKPASPR